MMILSQMLIFATGRGGASTNRGGFGDFQGKKVAFD